LHPTLYEDSFCNDRAVNDIRAATIRYRNCYQIPYMPEGRQNCRERGIREDQIVGMQEGHEKNRLHFKAIPLSKPFCHNEALTLLELYRVLQNRPGIVVGLHEYR
jgi:hypothetical protein